MFHGSMVALATPMAEDGAINDDALARLIEFHIDGGTDAIVPAGTTGESATLNFDEHCALVRRVVELVDGRAPVIAGTGANSTTEAIALTQAAKEAGADACLLITPYYNKPTQEGLYRHHRAIAEAVAIPQILYNVPGRTACDMLPETVARLAEVDNIVGIKEATAELARVRELRARCGEDFIIVSGDDATAMELMLHGGQGVISVTANIAPQAMHELCVAATSGDRAAAEAVDRRLAALHRDLFLESNPIPVKWGLYDMGLIPPGIRLPLTPLSEQHHQAVRAAIEQAGA